MTLDSSSPNNSSSSPARSVVAAALSGAVAAGAAPAASVPAASVPAASVPAANSAKPAETSDAAARAARKASAQINRAKCMLIGQLPWHGHIAQQINWLAEPRAETMGVRIVNGGEVQCLFSPAFVGQLKVEELCTVIQHEIEHLVRCHCLRAGSHNPQAWNVACDMVINGSRKSPRIGMYDRETRRLAIPFEDKIAWIPEGWPLNESPEFYLKRLGGDTNLGGYAHLDNHAIWKESDATRAEAREVVRGIVLNASQASGSNIPSHLRDALTQLDRAQVPWHALLRRFLSGDAMRRRKSYSHRNRRRDIFGWPGFAKRVGGKVSVVVDVSGSVSRDLLQKFFTEIEAICGAARLRVLLWDENNQGFFDPYRVGDWKRIPMRGGGGTNMAAPVEWLESRRLCGDCVVLFTDGYCEWPKPKGFPFVAVISSRPGSVGEPGWGKSIYLN